MQSLFCANFTFHEIEREGRCFVLFAAWKTHLCRRCHNKFMGKVKLWMLPRLLVWHSFVVGANFKGGTKVRWDSGPRNYLKRTKKKNMRIWAAKLFNGQRNKNLRFWATKLFREDKSRKMRIWVAKLWPQIKGSGLKAMIKVGNKRGTGSTACW